MVVDCRKQVIYWHNPRTGGRTVNRKLVRHYGFSLWKDDVLKLNYAQSLRPTHMHESVAFCAILGIDIEQYSHIVNVRNPYDRFLSGIAGMNLLHRPKLARLFNPDNLDEWVQWLDELAIEFAHANLFDLASDRENDWSWKTHIIWHTLTKQTTLRSKLDGTLLPMHLIRYENLEEDLGRVLSELGYPKVSSSIDHIGNTNKQPWRQAFESYPAAAAYARSYFKSDFIAYRYSTEI